MGRDVDREQLDPAHERRFRARLEECLEVLAHLLRRPSFGAGERTIGAECEVFLVDESARPLPLNEEVLAESSDPRLTVEVDRFNLECNLPPSPLAGRPFAALAEQLGDALSEARRAAASKGGRIAAIGILPTLTAADLTADAMTEVARYRALDRSLRARRREPFRVLVRGEEELSADSESVALEGANTSLHLHVRVEPAEFSALYNAVQAVSAPALAVAGNSPLFLGRRLWHETRVALFKQAVDDRDAGRRARHEVARVSFGRGWLEGGPLELFEDAVRLHEPLLSALEDEEPRIALESDLVPKLGELRLHQGTVWYWNRPVFDGAGEGHLRVEMRALPAGPTVSDMVANAAFLVGLAHGLAPRVEEFTRGVSFEQAQSNFYRAAQEGLGARLTWPGDRGRPVARDARELVLELLELAAEGLRMADVDRDEADAALAVIERRAVSRQTGATWQLTTLAALEPGLGRERALARLLERYLALSEAGAPVHEWPLGRE